MILRDLLRILGSHRRDGRPLSFDEAYRAFETIFSGESSEIQVGAFLIALRWKGVTTEELTGFASAARSHATIPCQDMPDLVCVAPPQDGVDHVVPLEVAASLAAAASGARVLLISDRAVPPKRGLTAANVLEHLDAHMTYDPAEAEEWVARVRFAAVAASGMLPALMGLRRLRGDLGVRTALSTVEKLLAPRNSALLIGAESGPVLGMAVEVIQSLGHPRGIAIQGVEGSVIPPIRRRGRGIELDGNRQVPLTVEPEDYGLASGHEPEIPLFGPPEEGYGSSDNPALVRAAGEATSAVLRGENGPARNAALLGAALILKTGGICATVADGVSAAAQAFDSGAARGVLERLKELC
jgi:anthranilate phosphoribosyltransferase